MRYHPRIREFLSHFKPTHFDKGWRLKSTRLNEPGIIRIIEVEAEMNDSHQRIGFVRRPEFDTNYKDGQRSPLDEVHSQIAQPIERQEPTVEMKKDIPIAEVKQPTHTDSSKQLRVFESKECRSTNQIIKIKNRSTQRVDTNPDKATRTSQHEDRRNLKMAVKEARISNRNAIQSPSRKPLGRS